MLAVYIVREFLGCVPAISHAGSKTVQEPALPVTSLPHLTHLVTLIPLPLAALDRTSLKRLFIP